MIKAIIFDLGAVCIKIDWHKINNEMMKKFNITSLVKDAGNKKAIKYYGESLRGKRDLKDVFKELDKHNHNLDEVIKFYKKMYKKHKKHDNKIYQLIKKLKNKLIVVCLSDTNSVHYEAHKEQGTIKDFHKVFTSFEIGTMKDDVSTFKKVLKKLLLRETTMSFLINLEI